MITPTRMVTTPRFGDTRTEFYRIRINKGGFILMHTYIPGVLTMSELLSEWIERRTH